MNVSDETKSENTSLMGDSVSKKKKKQTTQKSKMFLYLM
jgi:hypothetical protein